MLALLVALNAAFVVLTTWAYLTLIPNLVGHVLFVPAGGEPIGLSNVLTLPFPWPVYVPLIGAFLGAQVWYGYRSVLADVWDGTVEEADRPELHAIVTRLASAADIPAPRVAVVEADAPNCFTVGSLTNATIVVTEPLLAALEEDELETVLAHEITHVRNRDVTLMTVTSLFISIADRAYRAVLLLPRAVGNRGELSSRERVAADWMIPVLVLSCVFVAPLLWLFPPIARLANGHLSHQREFAADRGAAELTGKPLSLARALVSLHDVDLDVARTDLRHERSGTQSLCFLTYDVSSCSLSGRSAEETDHDRWGAVRQHVVQPRAWLREETADVEEHSVTSTHPPVDDRVRRLVALADDSEDTA